jgi:hypothetical protein
MECIVSWIKHIEEDQTHREGPNTSRRTKHIETGETSSITETSFKALAGMLRCEFNSLYSSNADAHAI